MESREKLSLSRRKLLVGAGAAAALVTLEEATLGIGRRALKALSVETPEEKLSKAFERFIEEVDPLLDIYIDDAKVKQDIRDAFSLFRSNHNGLASRNGKYSIVFDPESSLFSFTCDLDPSSREINLPEAFDPQNPLALAGFFHELFHAEYDRKKREELNPQEYRARYLARRLGISLYGETTTYIAQIELLNALLKGALRQFEEDMLKAHLDKPSGEEPVKKTTPLIKKTMDDLLHRLNGIEEQRTMLHYMLLYALALYRGRRKGLTMPRHLSRLVVDEHLSVGYNVYEYIHDNEYIQETGEIMFPEGIVYEYIPDGTVIVYTRDGIRIQNI